MDSTTLTHNQRAGSFSDLLTKINKQEESESTQIYSAWSAQEDADLKAYLELGKKRHEIADLLGRTVYAVSGRVRKLGLTSKPRLTDKQRDYIALNFPLYGTSVVAKKLKISEHKVKYEAKRLGLTYKPCDAYNPPIPKSLLPYHMVKRVSLLNRDCPASKNKVDDCVIVLYDKVAPSTPMMAMHLDDLLAALEQHFGRRAGVVTGALLSGYKA